MYSKKKNPQTKLCIRKKKICRLNVFGKKKICRLNYVFEKKKICRLNYEFEKKKSVD